MFASATLGEVIPTVSFFKKHIPEKSVLSVVIGSGAVHFGLALLPLGKVGTLVWQNVERFPFQQDVSLDKLESHVFEALARGSGELLKDGLSHMASHSLKKGRIDEIHVLYASPWFVSQAKALTVKHEKPFVVTEEVVKNIVHTEADALVKDSVDKKIFSSDMSIIEERITDIMLNGYSVQDPYGKKTENLMLTVFVSAVGNVFREKVESTLARFVHGENIQHHSFPVAFFSTVRDIFAAGKDFLMLYVGDELTDVTYARGESLRDTASFPIGRAGLIRMIVEDLKCLPEEAASFLSVKHTQNLKEPTKAKVQQALEKAAGVWAGNVRETLAGFLPQGGLPRALFLVPPQEADVFKLALERGDWFGKTTASIFDVNTMSGHALEPFLKASGNVRQVGAHAGVGTLYAQKTTTK